MTVWWYRIHVFNLLTPVYHTRSIYLYTSTSPTTVSLNIYTLTVAKTRQLIVVGYSVGCIKVNCDLPAVFLFKKRDKRMRIYSLDRESDIQVNLLAPGGLPYSCAWFRRRQKSAFKSFSYTAPLAPLARLFHPLLPTVGRLRTPLR